MLKSYSSTHRTKGNGLSNRNVYTESLYALPKELSHSFANERATMQKMQQSFLGKGAGATVGHVGRTGA